MPENQNVTEETIRSRAQQYYDEEGQPEGRDLDHWLRAERELRGEANSSDPRGDIPPATPETSASSAED